MHRQKVLLLCLLIGFTFLSASTLALAQSSPGFDLGCWGVLTSVGGEAQSPNFRVAYTLGEVAVGVTESSNARLRFGYIQDWRTLQPAAPTPGPTVAPGSVSVYLPVVNRYVRITRSCIR